MKDEDFVDLANLKNPGINKGGYMYNAHS